MEAQFDVNSDYEFSQDWFSVNIPVWRQLFEKNKPSRIAEIGSFEGRSAVFTIEQCAAHRPIELACIDPWTGSSDLDPFMMEGVERRFDRNIARAIARAPHKVNFLKIKEPSKPAMIKMLASGGTGTFDFVYVDGSHTAPDVLADAVLAFELARIGGVIAFDDYLWTAEQNGEQDSLNMCKPAIDAFVNLYQRRLHIVRYAPLHQLYVIKER